MEKRKVLFRLFLCIMILGAGFGIMQLMTSLKKAPDKQIPSNPGTLVETIQLTAGNQQVVVWGTGTVQPRRSAGIVPEVSGKITRLAPAFIAGEFFNEGDLLFEIESIDYELAAEKSKAAVSNAEYELARIESQSRVARMEWERIELDDKDTPNPLVLYEPQLKNARAALASAEADLEQRIINIRRTKLYAPFNCRIQSESIDLGQHVIAGQPVAVISGTDMAEIIVPVSLEDSQWLSIPRNRREKDNGSPADVRIEVSDKQFQWPGRIDRSLGELDPKGRMLRLVVRVKDPYRLISSDESSNPFYLTSGLFVDVRLKGDILSDVFSLPIDALRIQSSIWVMNADQVLEIRRVQVIRRERDRILVKGGLDPDDRIVLTYLSGAVPGMKLRPTKEGSR